MDQVLDIKPYIEHDPIIGYRYTANTRRRLPGPGGSNYEIVINSAGIRSTREYSKEKPPGVFRILVFGDSYAAGQFVSNEQRFSELLERRVPKLEVINFALEGTGTDQQLLIYENVGRQYEHDQVLLLPFLQNIRRNMADARFALDPNGTTILRPKPRFELVGGNLVLLNVPVSKDGLPAPGEGSSQRRNGTDELGGFMARLKTRVSEMHGAAAIKKLVYSAIPWEPFPEYRSETRVEWQLMEAIIRRFKESAGQRPVVIAPVFYDSYVRFRMARNYWDRFSSLTAMHGIHVIDLLPHFKRTGREAVRAFLGPYDCHFSAYGHLIVAEALESELIRLGLLPGCPEK